MTATEALDIITAQHDYYRRKARLAIAGDDYEEHDLFTAAADALWETRMLVSNAILADNERKRPAG